MLACAAAAAIAAALWALRIFGARGDLDFFTNDLRHYYLPIYEWAYAQIGQGVLPTWNPYNLTGIPYLGPGQAGFFYPPHVLYLLLPATAALAASHALHLVFAAAGFAGLAMRIGLAPGAAVVGAVLFAGRGMLPDLVLWPNFLESTAWLPIGCIGVVDCVRARPRRGVAIVGLAGGMSILAGSMQHVTFDFYAWGSLLVVLLVADRPRPRRRLEAAFAFVGGVLLAAGLGAAQLLPSLELAGLGARGMEALSSEHLGFSAAARALVAGFAVGSPYSFGAVTLVGVAAAARCLGRPVALWALGLGLVTWGFALGASTPLSHVYQILPGLPWFRGPARIVVVTQFCAAILVAFAVDHALARRGGAVRADATRAIPLVVGAALAVALHRRGADPAALLAIGSGVAFAASGFVARRFAVAALVALAVADGFSEPWRNGRMPYSQAALAGDPSHPEFHRALREIAGQDRVVWLAGAPRADLKRAPQYGLRLVDDYEAQNLRRQAEYFTWLRAGPDVTPPPRYHFKGDALSPGSFRLDDRLRPTSEMAAQRRLLDLIAVRWFAALAAVRDHPELVADVQAFVRDAGLVERASPDPGFALFENPHALPRAFVTYAAIPAPPVRTLLGILSAPGFDPLAASYVEGHAGFDPAPDAPARGRPAKLVRDEDRIVEVEADLDAPGLVVLADAYYPGWCATVDGAPAPILATNYLVRGVIARAGHHRIRFEYRPWGVPVGAAASALSLLFVIGLSFAPLRRGHVRPD